jgi:hypothetical protein
VRRNNFISLKERRTLKEKGIYKRVTENKKKKEEDEKEEEETMPDKENKAKKDKGKNTGIRTDKNW